MNEYSDMKDYLDKLRAKPEHVRNRIAFLLSSFIFVFIFTGWLFTKHAPNMRESAVLSESPSPLLVVANAFSGIKSQTQYIATSLQKNLNEAERGFATGTSPQSVGESASGTIPISPAVSSGTFLPSTSEISSPPEPLINSMTSPATSTSILTP